MVGQTQTVRVSGGVELDEFDYDYTKDLGERVQKFHDVNAIRDLQKFFEEHDAYDKADSLTDAITKTIDSISQDALEQTGFQISYYEDLYGGIGGWINDDTGLFIGELKIPIETTEQSYLDELARRVSIGWESVP